MSRLYRAHYRIFNTRHNDSARNGLFVWQDFPAGTSLADIRNGFWADKDGVPIKRLCHQGDTFVMPHQILSVEVML